MTHVLVDFMSALTTWWVTVDVDKNMNNRADEASENTLQPQSIQDIGLLSRLDAIKAREFPFRMLGGALKARDMPSARGWAPLIEKYTDAQATPEQTLAWLAGLDEIFANSLLYGDKAIAMFDIEQSVAETLASRLDTLIPDNSLFAQYFPFQAPHDALLGASLNPVGVDLSTEDGVSRLCLCSKRYFTSRETINTSSFDDTVRESFELYDEIIGVRRGVYQAYDFFVVNAGAGRLEIHLDICRPMLGQDIKKAFTHLRQTFEDWAFAECNVSRHAFQQRNFQPTVAALYSQLDGNVLKLDHATSTGSVKSERMRRHGSDLRVEDFHHAGMQAVPSTDHFGITKEWPGPSGIGHPSITVSGHFSAAGTEGSNIGFAIVRNCADGSDFELALSKLEILDE